MTLAPWVRLIAALLILLTSPSWASAIPQFTLSENIEPQSLPTLHWADASKVATPAQAMAAMVSGELITAGFAVPKQDVSHWFAVTLSNPTDHTINPSIYIKQTFSKTVNLHYQQQLPDQSQVEWISLLNGTDIPLKQRSVQTIFPAFNLSLAPHQEQTYYLETHNRIKFSRVNIRIGEAKDSYLFDLAHITIVKMFISASLLLGFINVLMYFSFRDAMYLYYSAYSISLTLLVMANNAFDLYFELPITDRSVLGLSYNCVVISLSLLVGKVLDAKLSIPWFYSMLKLARVLAVITAGLTLYDGSFFSYTTFVFFPFTVFVFGVSIYGASIGDKRARLLAIGIAVFSLSAVIVYLNNLALIPSNIFTDHATMFGALAQMLIFSMALFRHVLTISEDKNEANLALVHAFQEDKVGLEKAVHERTLELQQANRARGEFLATINHEMRTPLNGILGMVEMLQRKPSATEQETQLDHLGVASRQLSSLVEDVLDFSKIDENLISIQAEDFATQSLVLELTSLFSFSAEQKGIDLFLQVETDVSEWLRGDMPHLKRILINLIGNAIKFTDSGEVRLAISHSQPSERQSEDQADLITFEVSDTGYGMEQGQLQHVFSPYYQIEDQTQPSALKAAKVRNSGTGLGLAISEGLVKAMGGSIIVTSELGQGSRFSFTLPLPAAMIPDKEPNHLESETLDDNQNCFTGINILLVEDSLINQHVMTTFLQGTGARVSVFDTGTTAIDDFKDHGADLILMDYRLPDTDGLAVTKIIRAYEKQLGSPECPIVMHTADNRASLRDEAQLAGIGQLLSKPFTQTQLINIISQGLKISNGSDCPPLKPNTNPNLMPLLGDFLDLNLASIQLCRDSLTSGDVEALSSELHKCKGNSGLFGADELHQTVLDIEEALVRTPYDMDTLSTLLAQAERQLKGYRLWAGKLGG